jgi:hypothetical protein
MPAARRSTPTTSSARAAPAAEAGCIVRPRCRPRVASAFRDG